MIFTQSLAKIVGPTMAGAMIGLIGADMTILVDAGSYLANAALLAANDEPKVVAQPRSPPRTESWRDTLFRGVRKIRVHAALRPISIQAFTWNFGSGLVNAVLPVYILRTLHASPMQFAWVSALGALGAAAGGLLGKRIIHVIHTARICWVAPLGLGIFFQFLSLARPDWGLVLAIIGLAASGLSAVLTSNAAGSEIQRVASRIETGDELIAANEWLARLGNPLAALLGGALASATDPRLAIAFGPVVWWASALPVLFSPLRTVRDFEDLDLVAARPALWPGKS